jgi:phosphoglycolate phosphatase-like HAD superfamily hydrolase
MSIVIGKDIQTILWDLDGTILDSFSIYRDCLNKALLKNDRRAAPEYILRNNHHSLLEDSIIGTLHEMGESISGRELLKIIEDFYILDNAYIKDANHHLFEDAAKLMERVYAVGKVQHIVTNRKHGNNRGNGSPRTLIRRSRLSRFVSEIVCGDDTAFHKPQPELLQARFGELINSFGATLIIGDQIVDMELARTLSSRTILIDRGGHIVDQARAHPHYQYTDILSSLHLVEV